MTAEQARTVVEAALKHLARLPDKELARVAPWLNRECCRWVAGNVEHLRFDFADGFAESVREQLDIEAGGPT